MKPLERHRARPPERGSKPPVCSGHQGGSFGTSEDAFIAKLRDIDPADEPGFVEDGAIATENIVGDTEPATHGGELHVGQETESMSKARGRKRAGSSELIGERVGKARHAPRHLI